MSETTPFDAQVDDVAGRFKSARSILVSLAIYLAGLGTMGVVRQAADGPPTSTVTVAAGKEARLTGPCVLDLYPDRCVGRGGTLRYGLSSTLPATTAPVGS